MQQTNKEIEKEQTQQLRQNVQHTALETQQHKSTSEKDK